MNLLPHWLPLVLIISLVACRPGESVPDALHRLGAGQPPKPTPATNLTATGQPGGPPPGSVETRFAPDPNGEVHEVILQPDGKILICGNFTTVGGANGRVRNYIARLNADGTLDASFSSKVDNSIVSAAVQPNGKIIITGPFYSVGGVERHDVARLNADGTLDSGFVPPRTRGMSSYVGRVTALRDGKSLIGGSWVDIDGFDCGHLAQLSTNGNLDKTFDPKVLHHINQIVLQSDGKILIGGSIFIVKNVRRKGVVRLHPDGSLDAPFNADTGDSSIETIVLQPDGKILVGGTIGSVGEMVRNRIARLNADGSVDESFNPNVGGDRVDAIALQSDGKIVVGGHFETVGGAPRKNIARLLPDGALDMNFNCAVEGESSNTIFPRTIHSIAIQSDGSIIVGGRFDQVNGVPRHNLARLSGK